MGIETLCGAGGRKSANCYYCLQAQHDLQLIDMQIQIRFSIMDML